MLTPPERTTNEITRSYLLTIFNQINTHLTFLSSHSRSTIPTFELLHKLNPSITILDLTIIKEILPSDDVTFTYVDENQVLTSLKEKVQHSWTSGYKQTMSDTVDDSYEHVATHDVHHPNDVHKRPTQLLIFDFKDVKTHGIGAAMLPRRKKAKKNEDGEQIVNKDFFLSCKELSMQNLTQKQLLAIIVSRNKKFKDCLLDFLERHSHLPNPMEYLVESSKKKIPIEEVFEDPIDLLSTDASYELPNSSTKPTVDQMVEVLKLGPFYKDQIIHEKLLTEARDPTFGKFPEFDPNVETENENNSTLLHPDLISALEKYKNISIERGLYIHQVKAIKSLFESQTNHVIVSTATSSGKSLIYQIPILNRILWDITESDRLEQGLTRRKTTAFFIFPTKALAQDQKRHLQELIDHLEINSRRRIIVDTYDGDTPNNERRQIRKYADIIFTNPDTIHASILPNHSRVCDSGWTEFLTSLKFVVIDEIHVYKGTFGVHVSYVMRRMNRLVHILKKQEEQIINEKLQYISCSATILNPVDHFRIICGLSSKHDNIIHVSEDGSPCGDKLLLMWNPPALMNKQGMTEQRSSLNENKDLAGNTLPIVNPFVPRENIVPELAKVLVHLLTHFPSIKVIVFCPIRKVCEYLMREVRLLLTSNFNKNAPYPVSGHDVMSYRGGYSKTDRRLIELRMFEGKLRAIVATNALELGIDLAELDVVISCGFPRLKLNLHQQIGRAGRSAKSNSLALYVCGSTPVDDYFKKNPDELHNRDSYEDLCVAGLIDLDLKMFIMEMHLQCAAFEFPIDLVKDIDWFVPNTSSGSNQSNQFVKACRDKLYKDDNGKYRTHPSFLPWPADHVSIRAVEETNYAVVDTTNGKNVVIEEVEALRTSFTLYEGAIFLHQGLPYLVKEFDSRNHFAKVERVNVEWLTQQRDFTDVDPIEIEFVKCLLPPDSLQITDSNSNNDTPVFYGKIEIVTIVFGYFKVNRRAEILEAVEVKNPPMRMVSKGFWLDIPTKAIELVLEKELNPAAGIHAAQHALMNILPLFISGGATTNPNVRFNSSLGEAELKTECKAPEKEFAQRQSKRKRPPRLIFHDSKGGQQGTGVSAKTFEHIDEILYATYVRVRDCECDWGCPLCVAAGFCKEMMLVMSKPAAEIFLGALIGIPLETLDEQVRNGPEENLPEIKIETISNPVSVKFSPNVQIVETKIRENAKNVSVKQEIMDSTNHLDVITVKDEEENEIKVEIKEEIKEEIDEKIKEEI